MEFIESSKGGKGLMLNGYMHTKKAVKKNRIHWECSQRAAHDCKLGLLSKKSIRIQFQVAGHSLCNIVQQQLISILGLHVLSIDYKLYICIVISRQVVATKFAKKSLLLHFLHYTNTSEVTTLLNL